MNIYQAITAVMKDCGYIGKDSVNDQQKYRFRGIDAVMNALNPAFIKNHVFCSPEVLEQTREERTTPKGTTLIYSVVRVKYTFYAEDGSCVVATVCGEGMDSGDKATNKAMSAAFKYACFQLFCIPTEEMRDSEEDSPEVMPREARRSPLEAPQTASNGSPDNLITPKQKAALFAEINRTGRESIKVLKHYGITPNDNSRTEIARCFDMLTKWQASDAIDKLKKCPDKAS